MFGTLRKKLLSAVDDYFGLLDEKGTVLICSDQDMEGQAIDGFEELAFGPNGLANAGGLIFSRINSEFAQKYFVFIKETSLETYKVLKILNLYVENFLRQHMEKHNKYFFYKKLLGNEFSENEAIKSSAVYKIRNEAARAVIVIKHGESEYPVSGMITNIFPDKKKNTVVDMDANTVAYVVELQKNEDSLALKSYCRKIVDTIEEELMISASAGIGNIVGTLCQISSSYQNACIAMSVGAIFEFETSIYDFNTLGIGKLIYNSEKKVLEEFLRESISKKTFELLDDEIIKTVRSFFKNNLNISETARRMYLHRNTLVYRIEKVQKLTGLDLRNFDDAVSFKAAYMVKCYMDKLNQSE
ncbi:MAG: helix-turn-helix domain-containing protein [Clostridia bacterium]|nr:helix-turn-helix domain-containing protein [Clostridia bacterium]